MGVYPYKCTIFTVKKVSTKAYKANADSGGILRDPFKITRTTDHTTHKEPIFTSNTWIER